MNTGYENGYPPRRSSGGSGEQRQRKGAAGGPDMAAKRCASPTIFCEGSCRFL